MAKSSPNAPSVFSTLELACIHELLKSKSIEGFWEVGRILNERFTEHRPYGVMKKLEPALRALGGGVPVSLAQLHQCRQLNATWKKEDVDAAKRAGLPWGRAFVLIYIWREATQRQQPEIVDQCKKLIAAYGGLGRGKKGAWNAAVNALRKQVRDGDGVISNLRLLGEKKAAVVLRLNAAAQIIDEMREFLPAEAHTTCSKLKANAERLIPLIEKMCERHMTAEQ